MWIVPVLFLVLLYTLADKVRWDTGYFSFHAEMLRTTRGRNINMRTADAIPEDTVEYVNDKTYRKERSDSCILDMDTSAEIIV